MWQLKWPLVAKIFNVLFLYSVLAVKKFELFVKCRISELIYQQNGQFLEYKCWPSHVHTAKETNGANLYVMHAKEDFDCTKNAAYNEHHGAS